MSSSPFHLSNYLPPSDEKYITRAHIQLTKGVRDFMQQAGFQKVILGLSGGIDSAVVMVLLCDALGAQNVHALLMPSAFSSSHSISDARELCEHKKLTYDIMPIADIYDTFLKVLAPYFANTTFSLAEENLQSRVRGVLLMAVSNKENRLLMNTSNRSELCVGYGTLYGDLCGSLSVIGSLYKTQVYALAHYLNAHGGGIPYNIITKAPSAELHTEQKDSDSLPEYPVLDAVLYQHIEQQKTRAQIIALGFSELMVDRVLHLYKSGAFKRAQFCPVLSAQ